MSDRNHLLVTAGLFLGVLLLGCAVLVWPAHREVSSMRQEIQSLQTKADHLDEMTAVAEVLAGQLHEARQQARVDLRLIPDSPDLAGLMRRLSLPVDGVSVVDQTFSAGTPTRALNDEEVMTRAIPLSIEMKGRFDAVFAVMRAAESMDRLLRVSSVRLSADRDRQKNHAQPWLSASIGLEAIYEPEGSTAYRGPQAQSSQER